jgi:la-related protein 1
MGNMCLTFPCPRPTGPQGSEATSPIDPNAVEPIRHYWVKDNDQPIEQLPQHSESERYPILYAKALREREESPKGSCPHNLVVLYQFWSHFLIRNFNTRMYNEFRRLALDDLENRDTSKGIHCLLKYYKEALSNEKFSMRERVARHYVNLANKGLEANDDDRQRAFKQLQSQWRRAAMDSENREVLDKFVNEALRTALEKAQE